MRRRAAHTDSGPLLVHRSRDTRAPCLAHRRAPADPDVIVQASPVVVEGERGVGRVIFD